VGGLAILVYFVLYLFIDVYFYNTHQVLVGLPKGVSSLANLFYCIYFSLLYLFSYYAPSAHRAPPTGWWPWYFIFVYFVYVHNTHQVLVGLPQAVGGLAILFYFIMDDPRRTRTRGHHGHK
jgi:hypothetical protein